MNALQDCPTPDRWRQILALGELESDISEWFSHLESCSTCRVVVDGLTDDEVGVELRQPAASLAPACRHAMEQLKNHLCKPSVQTAISSSIRTADVVTFSPMESRNMTACIHIERMMHRSSIAVTGESVAGYTLIKLIPTGLTGSTKPVSLNLALVVDISGSMYEQDGTGVSRLERVQDAAVAAIKKLRPEDTLAVIGFAHNARVLLSATPIAEIAKIEDVIRRIGQFDVDPGGTAMDEGLALAMTELEMHAEPGKLSQVVMLTDGETSGEQNCRTLARKAAEKRVHLTLMGIGLDWKASLIKDLASISQGKWHYIDVTAARETTRVFAAEFDTLAATGFLDVQMHLRPMKDVAVKRIRQVVPEIKDVTLEAYAERNLLGRLGTLQNDLNARYVLDLELPKRPDGKYLVAHLELTYDLGNGRRESSGEIPLEMNYTAAGNGFANAEVMKYVDDIQLKEMSDNLRKALESQDPAAAKQLAQEMETKAKAMGERAEKKTKMARAVLDELGTKGRVSRKTQMVIDDVSRISVEC